MVEFRGYIVYIHHFTYMDFYFILIYCDDRGHVICTPDWRILA